MLRMMRKHSKWLLWMFLVAIIVVFVFSFGYSSRMGQDRVVAEVGKYKISAYDFNMAFEQTQKSLRNQYGEKYEEMLKGVNLREKVMRDLEDQYLLLQEAEKMGLSLSDGEYKDVMNSLGPDVYAAMLRENRLDAKTFEKKMRQDLLVRKVIGVLIDNGAPMDEKSLYRRYLKERGQVKFSFAVFSPDDYKDKATLSDKEIESMYEKEKSLHRSEATYHLLYAVIDEKSTVKDDQAYMDLLKAKDIVAYGQSKGLAVQDLGVLSESEIGSRFGKLKLQDEIKDMKKGDISLPAREGNKSYIFQVVDRTDGKPLEKAEVVAIIKNRITREEGKKLAQAKAEEGIRTKSVSLSHETPFIPRGLSFIPGVGALPKEGEKLFDLTKGQTFVKPLEIGDKYYVFACADEKQPDPAEWDKNKEALKKMYAKQAGMEYLKDFTEILRKKVKITENWKEI